MLCKEKEGEMKVTVRCYFIPADIIFDTDDVKLENTEKELPNAIFIYFQCSEPFFSYIVVDKEHYLEQIGKKDV
jgi:hypothetical protein